MGASLDKHSDDSVESSTTSSDTQPVAGDQPAVEPTDAGSESSAVDSQASDAGQTVVVFPDDDSDADK